MNAPPPRPHGPTTIAVIGDVHSQLDAVDAVCGALARRGPALIVLAGDVGLDLPFRRAPLDADLAAHHDSIARVLTRVRAVGAPIAWVPGNHDWPQSPHEDNADGVVMSRAGLRIAGTGGAGPARFGFPYEWDEADCPLPRADAADVLVCHTPPWGTRLDLAGHGEHVGSRAVAEFCANFNGLLVCGHIHEARGAERVGAALCVNAGALARPYAHVGYSWIEWQGPPSSHACLVEQVALDGGKTLTHEFLPG